MDDLKELLEKNLEMSEKSLKILKNMRRANRARTVFSALKWALIIGLTAYSFVQIQPYIDTLLKTYQQIYQGVVQINKLLPK